jgi:hypothetical protein
MKHKTRLQTRVNRVRNETDLILALESARTSFVVAVALEQKSTTRRLWRVYLETEDRLRHCLKELRVLGQARCAGSRQCAFALEALVRSSELAGQQPGQGDARHLYFMLQEVLAHLEKMALG